MVILISVIFHTGNNLLAHRLRAGGDEAKREEPTYIYN